MDKILEGKLHETKLFCSFERKVDIMDFSKEDQKVLKDVMEIELMLSPQLLGFQVTQVIQGQFFETGIKEVNLNINDFDLIQDHVEEVCHRYKNHPIKVKVDHTSHLH